MNIYKTAGRACALQKLGTFVPVFDSPEEAAQHESARNVVGGLAGLAGALGGAYLGSKLKFKTPYLFPNLIASALGAYGGYHAAAIPAKQLFTSMHDATQHAEDNAEQFQARTNVAAGFPSGVTKDYA